MAVEGGSQAQRDPAKPKWMRWRTYNRLEEKFDRYEEMLERGIGPLLAKLLEKCS